LLGPLSLVPMEGYRRIRSD